MTDAPRALHVVESWRPVISGYTSRGWNVVREQRQSQIARPRVLVSSRQFVHGGEPAVEAPAEVPIDQLEPSRREQRWRRGHRWFVDGEHLARAIAEHGDADLVHVHAGSTIGSAAALAARRSGRPLVAEVRFDLAGAVASETMRLRSRTAETLLRRWFERHLRHASVVVAASHSLGRLIEEQVPGLRVPIIVVPNGATPVSSSERERVRQALGVQGRWVVGSTSNMLRYENLEAVVDSARLPGVHVLLVGDGPRRRELQRLAAAQRLPVTFTGPVAPEQIPHYLAAMDAFAVPRRDATICRYASPLKVMEAMAMGLPVIATAVGDLPWLLGSGRGRLLPAEAPDTLREVLADLQARPDEACAMGAAARCWVLSRLSWPSVCAGYRDAYREVMR